MNRRVWMKLVAAGTPAALFYSGIKSAGRADAIYIVTDDPGRAVSALTANGAIDLTRMHVSTRAVAPSRQDVTIIRRGRLIDPARTTNLNRHVVDLAADLRARQIPGCYLVSIEAKNDRRPDGDVLFECDGHPVESVAASRSYRQIPIAGVQGETTFSFVDGRLSVVRSSCRHELCRRSGEIRAGRIICAPNRLVATIGHSIDPLDAITG